MHSVTERERVRKNRYTNTHLHWNVCVHFRQILYVGKVIMSHTLALWLGTSNKKEKSHAKSERRLWLSANRRVSTYKGIASSEIQYGWHEQRQMSDFQPKAGFQTETTQLCIWQCMHKKTLNYHWNGSVGLPKRSATSAPIDKCINKRCLYILRNCNTTIELQPNYFKNIC